ncbi:hypothetical protein [Pseudomonas sp. YuFO8]|uniref:hypothetical protein n=1 Tax=Pseudomonas sp. YuFO8 TaxID=3095361 RepID=UPI002B2506AA|nr:hypothetical protein [Pseudomonas sp. YuFO8]MEB2623779.1 hypothetical protein [Pseudomonas sp. YuFO8]
MFISYNDAEVPIGQLCGDSSIRHWRYVELALNDPWFHVSIAFNRKGKVGHSNLLLATLREFEQLLSDCDDDLWLEQVLVVTPRDINGSERWQMDRLMQLTEAIDQQDSQFVYTYTLDNGSSFVIGECSAPQDTCNIRIVYDHSRDVLGHSTI